MSLVVKSVDLGGVEAVPSRLGLTIVDTMGFNDWRALGDRLVRMGDSAAWWIGDWRVFGNRFREAYPDGLSAVDLNDETVRRYAYVAERVPREERESTLSFRHHMLVAGLDQEARRRWLDDAARGGWSTRDLEQALAEARVKPGRAPALSVRAEGALLERCEEQASEVGMEPREYAVLALEVALGDRRVRAAIAKRARALEAA